MPAATHLIYGSESIYCMNELLFGSHSTGGVNTSMCSSSSFAMARFWLSRRRPLASNPMASGSFSASCASTSARAFLAASKTRLSASAA